MLSPSMDPVARKGIGVERAKTVQNTNNNNNILALEMDSG